MSTTYGAGLGQTPAPTRRVSSFSKRYWGAFQERRKRDRLRADLGDLSDKELTDIGITRGEIESHRFPRDLDLAMRAFQVDGSWYENYWLKERKPRPVGMVARNLPTIVSCLRLACDRVASVRRAVLPTHPEI